MTGPSSQGSATHAAEEHGGAGWRRLAGRSLWASAFKSLAIVAGAAAGLTRFLLGRDWAAGGIVAACAGAAVLIVAAVLAYDAARLRTTRWRLTRERLELRSGLTVRQHRSIPRDRVRSVDLRADPVRRAFGLSVVKVGTGEHAAEGAELVLDPLTRHDAEELRRVLLHQEADAVAVDGPLAELRWSWIRYAPLSLWTFTGAALVLGALYKALDSIGFKRLTTSATAGLWDWVTAQPLVAVPLLLAVNTVAGALGAVLLFAESWGRYRLEREPGRLRLRRGLLTTRSLTMEERRLRGVEISEPLLLRLAGGARVKAIATGLGKAAKDETEDVAALTPPLPRRLAGQIAANVAGARVPGLVAHPAAARRRRVVRALVTSAVLAAGTAAASWALPWPWLRAGIWLVPVAALAAGLWLAASGAGSLGHALGGRHLVSRSGAVVRRTIALDRRGIAGWTITESYVQRRSGLLTVSATTAAGSGHYDVLDVGRGDGLDLAAHAVPGLLEPFLERPAPAQQ
ncbi:PH domain-containing protein [Nonomuraea rosea]|uniref:PH domain-containing protein n=1 Tax=Nonomuraea rosea TaxID=638574 RepID=A0ABP6WSD6_9ACTN